MVSEGESKGVGALRRLPSVDRLLQNATVAALAAAHGHDLAVAAAREALAQARRTITAGDPAPTLEMLAALVRERLSAMLHPTLRPVINATGVIIHTNLGRAPLSEAARRAMETVARGYSNLEYDLEAGERGSRHLHAEALLCRLTGAEAALVVNNNAAAVLLALTVLAAGREVVISRGQLVEIGGGFRIPEVLKQSGARLVEVGTTNRTHPRDYEAAIGENTALLLRVHASNFKQIGFVTQVSLAELVEIGRRHNLPIVDDLGSGTLLDTTVYGLAAEPTVQESVQAGATLTTFSGDKLLGGPQGGIIVGRREIVEQLRRHPLTRALRVDKVTLAGLQATLLHYLRGEAVQTIPVWRMIAISPADIQARARRWAEALTAAGLPASVIPGESTIGGGSLPGETLPTALVALKLSSPDAVAARLRAGDPPIIVRIAGDKLLLDPRTVLPDEDEAMLDALRRI